MILLRSLQFRQARATHVVMDLLSCGICHSFIVTSVYSTLRRTSGAWPKFKAIAIDVKDERRCLPSLNSVERHFHGTQGFDSLGQNANNKSRMSEKLSTAVSVKTANAADSSAVRSDSLLVKDESSVTSDVLKLDVESEKSESRIHLDESKRQVIVYVDNAFQKTKATDLYTMIRKMDVEQVLSLVEHSHHVLDKTHLALCMKRLFTLSAKCSQHCDVDVVRRDQRFQILCAYVAKKSRYLQPAILNDIVTFLCHFGIGSSHPVMQVCLQLMMKQINNLALDQLTVLVRALGTMEATKQTRVLREAIAVLCNTRSDQLPMLSVEHKIYLLEECGCKLQYINELLESLWDDRGDIRKWQQAVGFFVALAKAAAPTDTSDSTGVPQRHEYLEEWCIDILLQQYTWLNVDDIEALLAALVQLGIYDGELLRILGDHTRSRSSELESWLSVWNLLADADYMHVGLMGALLTHLKMCDIPHMSVDTQLSLLAFLAEAVNYYRGQNTHSEQLADQCFDDKISVCVEELSKTLHTTETVPADVQLDTCLYLTMLGRSPPDLLSSRLLDSCTADLSAASLLHDQSQACPSQLDKLVLLANLNSSNSVHTRVLELTALVCGQCRPRSALRPTLLMVCDSVTHGHTTSLGFYADHLVACRTSDKQSIAVCCWSDSQQFWINTGRLKCMPHLYVATMQKLHPYHVLVVNASAWLSLSERERLMYIEAAVNKDLQGLTVV